MVLQTSGPKLMSARINHMPGLDGLRAFAVAGVVWHHAGTQFDWLPITRHGFLGVDLFFVLSGFLITTLLLREQELRGRISLKCFYIRRTLRIFPLYYAVLIGLTAYFALEGEGSSQRAAFFAELPFHATYLSNWIDSHTMLSITWSLSTEEQFYLVSPMLLLVLGRRSLAVVVPILVLNQVVNFGFLDSWLRGVGLAYEEHPILQATFTPLCCGFLLAIALANRSVQRLAARLAPGHALAPLCLLLLATASIPGELRGWPRLSFHLVATGLIGAIVLNPTHWVSRALEWRPVAYVGKISYGIYLLHLLVIYVVRRLASPELLDTPGAVFLLSLTVTVFLASLSYIYFERPLLQLKDRYR